MDALPNFLVIGAARSGTNSLYRWLGQHPEICVSPVKEPRFFAFEDAPPAFAGHKPDDYTDFPTWTSLAEYRRLFRPVAGQRAVGEASTVYLYYPGERPAERIRFHVPDAKLIAILRQPAERAYSNYLLAVQHGWEPLPDFAAALAAEDERARAGWSYFLRYRRNGLYHQQLARFYARFPAMQIRVLLYDDLCARPLAVMREVFAFLGVDDRFTPDVSRRHLRSGRTRSAAIARALASRHPLKLAVARRLPARLRRVLRDGVE
ncbi:MAG TPA: sulfotransferase, partial [Candidatus Binatia bacterium]|nr:sulfotransferase [Candidatus Binatia bacterium]